jgi:O-methyltransferase
MAALDRQRVDQIYGLAERLDAMIELDGQRVAQLDELVAKLGSMIALDKERLAHIDELAHKLGSMASLNQQRVRQIDELAGKLGSMATLDQQRVGQIDDLAGQLGSMSSLDQQRVGQIDDLTGKLGSMATLDQQRVGQIDELASKLGSMASLDQQRVGKIAELGARLHTSDGIAVVGRNLSFLDEPNFARAWEKSKTANNEGWPAGVPDVRWRAHIVLWAARRGLALEGDFVECGVHTGLYSLVILEMLDLEKAGKVFHLFDTFNGIPMERLTNAERKHATMANASIYRDVWTIAQRNFAPHRAARLVKGELPVSLDRASIGKIAFLSMDLNNAIAEKETIERLWDKIVPGAAIVLDDFAWVGLEDQHAMWLRFAATKGCEILTLPTGQGLIIVP